MPLPLWEASRASRVVLDLDIYLYFYDHCILYMKATTARAICLWPLYEKETYELFNAIVKRFRAFLATIILLRHRHRKKNSHAFSPLYNTQAVLEQLAKFSHTDKYISWKNNFFFKCLCKWYMHNIIRIMIENNIFHISFIIVVIVCIIIFALASTRCILYTKCIYSYVMLLTFMFCTTKMIYKYTNRSSSIYIMLSSVSSCCAPSSPQPSFLKLLRT